MNSREPFEGEGQDAEAVRGLLAPLADAGGGSDDGSDGGWTRERADRTWAAIEAATLNAPQPSVFRRIAPLAAAAAVAAAVLWTLPADQPAGVTRTTEMTGRILTETTTLPSGARVEVEGEIRLAAASEARTRIELRAGRVTSTVPPLAAGETYVVVTPAAEVAVRGTRFTVIRTVDGGTDVSVTEGVVEVTPTGGVAFLLRAGESRQVPAPGSAKAEQPTAEAARARSAQGDWRAAVSLWRRIAHEDPDPLARQNAMVAAGRLLNEHAPDEAVEIWSRLNREHRAGPHAEEAAYGYADALRRAGRLDAARAAAADFRKSWPDSPYAAGTRDW